MKRNKAFQSDVPEKKGASYRLSIEEAEKEAYRAFRENLDMLTVLSLNASQYNQEDFQRTLIKEGQLLGFLNAIRITERREFYERIEDEFSRVMSIVTRERMMYLEAQSNSISDSI